VIEQSGLPLRAVMARDAARNAALGELFAVDIFVTAFTLGRRGLEIDVRQLGFQIRRSVAIRAGGGAMRSNERKICLGMIESRQLVPRLGRVAGFAARRLTVRSRAAHPLLELSFVRIGVAGRAIKILPMVNRGHFVADLNRFFVTLTAGYSDVTAGEQEAGLLMTSQRERGRAISLKGMTLLALIEPGSGSELRGVPVGMAVGA